MKNLKQTEPGSYVYRTQTSHEANFEKKYSESEQTQTFMITEPEPGMNPKLWIFPISNHKITRSHDGETIRQPVIRTSYLTGVVTALVLGDGDELIVQ